MHLVYVTFQGAEAKLNKILRKDVLGEKIKRMVVEVPLIPRKALPGQFVVLRVDEKGERIPLTIAGADKDRGTIDIIFQEVGTTTAKLGRLDEGDAILNVAGPLGRPLDIESYGTVCIVAGGVGAAFIYWAAKAFKEAGNRLITIMGARSENLLILKDEMSAISDDIYIATDDGSMGEKGFTSDVLKRIINEGAGINYLLTAGPIPMMEAISGITAEHGIKTIASLNPLMIDGTGMCGGCRVTVGGQVKFACVDGPDFDAHRVNFRELMQRTSHYRNVEQESYRKFQHRCRLEDEDT